MTKGWFLTHLFDSSLFQLNQGVVGADRVQRLDVDCLDHSGSGGPNALLHFHGFHHANLLPGGDPLTGPDRDGHYPAGHGGT